MTPPDLYATSDIRFVMVEVGKLTSATDNLSKAVDRLTARMDAQSDKIEDLRRSVSFVRGIIWTFGILGVLIAPLLTWLLNHSFPPSAPPAAPTHTQPPIRGSAQP